MKRFVKVLSVMTALAACFMLAACGLKYSTSYSAVSMMRNNTSEKGSLSFGSFEGSYVFQAKGAGGALSCEAELGEGSGSLTVYYDAGDGKTELFKVNAGESKRSATDKIASGTRVYIIIESDGKCVDGSFAFTMNG